MLLFLSTELIRAKLYSAFPIRLMHIMEGMKQYSLAPYPNMALKCKLANTCCQKTHSFIHYYLSFGVYVDFLKNERKSLVLKQPLHTNTCIFDTLENSPKAGNWKGYRKFSHQISTSTGAISHQGTVI